MKKARWWRKREGGREGEEEEERTPREILPQSIGEHGKVRSEDTRTKCRKERNKVNSANRYCGQAKEKAKGYTFVLKEEII